MESFDLDNIRMNVIQTAPNGVVNQDTIFNFTQEGNLVHATYSGGKIIRGFLVGKLNGDMLHFSYCQIQADHRLDNGVSKCKLSKNPTGKIVLTEHFEWNSREGESGINIFEQI